MACSSSPAVNGVPWTLVTESGIDEELGSQQPRQLAEVHLGNEHLRIAPQHRLQVPGERVEVTQMRVRDLVASRPHTVHAAVDRAPRRPPTDDEQLGVVASPSISTSGMSSAMPAIFAARRRTMNSWFSGS